MADLVAKSVHKLNSVSSDSFLRAAESATKPIGFSCRTFVGSEEMGEEADGAEWRTDGAAATGEDGGDDSRVG